MGTIIVAIKCRDFLDLEVQSDLYSSWGYELHLHVEDFEVAYLVGIKRI